MLNTITEEPERLAHFRARLLADAYLDASAEQWERTAERMEWAAWRPGDYPGRSTLAELQAQRARCLESARLARHRATLERRAGHLSVPPVVWAELAEGVV